MPETITVEIEVADLVTRKIAELAAERDRALGLANSHECDALFWQERCEAAERERDELKERLAAAAAEGEQDGTLTPEDTEKRRVP